MTSIGQVGHVLTDAGLTGQWASGTSYECVDANGTYRRSDHLSAGTTTHDIQYTSSGWVDAHPTGNPNKFKADELGGSVIVPPVTATTLYLYQSAYFLIALNTGYGSSSGSGSGSGGASVSSSNKVFRNFW